MSTETLKDKVIFGRSVTKETMVVSYSTSCKIMEQSTIKITKRSLTGIQTGYKNVTPFHIDDDLESYTWKYINKHKIEHHKFFLPG